MYIGIDLGTSNSAIAGVENGAAQIFRPTDGGEVLPSVIFIDKRGHRLYGRRAYDQAMTLPENVAMGFKRLLGTTTPITVGDQELSPEECSAEIIRQLLGQATTETGEETFEGVVIAVPAAFNQLQCEATLRAAKLAGLDKVDLIQEPVAAAMASMADAKRSGKFIIYDMGGGTFDVALVEADQGKVRIIAQEGVNMLGGRDFDRLIVTEVVRPWLLANFDLPEKFLRDPEYRRLSRLAQLAAERAKIDLSSLEEASIFASDDEIRLTDDSETELFLDAPITRSQFEELIRDPVQNTVDLIKRLLEDNNVAPADVDRIVFVGGSSRIPLVRRMVTESLGITADLKTDPMTAVAEGAAYYCENRLWETAPAQEGQEEPTIVSEPKPAEAHLQSPSLPDLSFDYQARTPDDKTTITVGLAGEVAEPGRIRLMTEGWDSGLLPLSNGMTISAPLPLIGDNTFDVQVMDASGQTMQERTEKLVICRLVATSVSVPATHSIAVKVRTSVESEENCFMALITKGDTLPAQGQLQLGCGTNLKGGGPGHISFEVFQVDYPERVDLNLCIGLLRVQGTDLPKGQMVRVGDPIVFDWEMNEGGILRAVVSLPSLKIKLQARCFYAPQAAEMSFQGENGLGFAHSILACAREEWGDLAAAIGPQAGPEVALLRTRLEEQEEMLEESIDDPDSVRRICEETRFIRQDTLRLSQKYMPAVLQRQLGKTSALFNRLCRSKADSKERAKFDDLATKVQKIIDTSHENVYSAAQLCLSDMKRLSFIIAWRNPTYIKAWFNKLAKDTWLFADARAFESMVAEGRRHIESGDDEALRALVERMLDARISLGASDAVTDLATIVKA